MMWLRQEVIAITALAACVVFTAAQDAAAQSSSLYLSQPGRPTVVNNRQVHPQIQQVSLTAILAPEPRTYAVHDLVTIIIREQTTADSSATLDSEKELELKGTVKKFPSIRLSDLFKGKIGASNKTEDEFPNVDLDFENEFEGKGKYQRRDSVTTRLTARVIDVRPNNILVLEARTEIQNDDENQVITVTGYCRQDDIAADNTVLSTQMYDLRFSKQHKGELRNASKKGIITKILDAIFNF